MKYNTLKKLGFSLYGYQEQIIKYYPTIRIEKLNRILKQI
jgi:hypothetical protein